MDLSLDREIFGTGHDLSCAGDSGMIVPFLNWSVFDFGKCRRNPSLLNSRGSREIRVSGHVLAHLNFPCMEDCSKSHTKGGVEIEAVETIQVEGGNCCQ